MSERTNRDGDGSDSDEDDRPRGLTDPAHVLSVLKHLPEFPDEGPIEVSTVATAGYLSSTAGPCALIREVMFPPAHEPYCPIRVYTLLEEARILHNIGQYERALAKLETAAGIWADKERWIERAGKLQSPEPLTPMKEEEPASPAVGDGSSPAVTASGAPLVSAMKQPESSPAADASGGGGHHHHHSSVSGKGGLKGRKNMSIKIYTDKNLVAGPASGPSSGKPGNAAAANPNLLSAETKGSGSGAVPATPGSAAYIDVNVSSLSEMQFQLYVQNSIGAIRLSQAQDSKALMAFWKAKEVYDEWCVEQVEEQKKAKIERELKERLRITQDLPSAGGWNALFKASSNANANASATGADGGSGGVEASFTGGGGDTEKQNEKEDALLAAAAASAAAAAAEEAGLSGGAVASARDEKAAPIHPYDWPTPVAAVHYSNLGQACFHLGKYELAMRCFQTTLQIRFSTINPLSPEYIDVGATLNNLGCCLYELRRYTDAYTYFQSAEEVFTNKLDRVQPRLNAVRNNIERVQPLRKKIHPDELILSKQKPPPPPPRRIVKKKSAAASASSPGASPAGANSGKGSSAAPAKSSPKKRPTAPPPPPPPAATAKPAKGIIELRSWRVAMTEFNKLIETYNKPKPKKKKILRKKKTGNSPTGSRPVTAKR